MFNAWLCTLHIPFGDAVHSHTRVSQSESNANKVQNSFSIMLIVCFLGYIPHTLEVVNTVG